MKISIDENYSKFFLSSGYESFAYIEQILKESSNIGPVLETISNAYAQIKIPPTQEDSFMSIILKVMKKSSK
jgi:hypothetical protein